MKENEQLTKQDSGLPSRQLIGSTAAVADNAERLTKLTNVLLGVAARIKRNLELQLYLTS